MAIAEQCEGQDNPLLLMADMIRDNYQLHGILAARKLQKRVNTYGTLSVGGLCVALHRLGEEFERPGRRVVIELVTGRVVCWRSGG